MLELLEWVQLANVKKLVVAQSVSNALFILYVISYKVSNKGCLLTAFILCELIANSHIVSNLSNSMYYLVDMSIYSILYVYVYCNKGSINTMLGCVIMVLFDIGMALDAIIYKNVSTLIWEYYTPINLSIHLYLISTLFRWSSIRGGVGSFFRASSSFFRVNDSFSFFWYHIEKHAIKR